MGEWRQKIIMNQNKVNCECPLPERLLTEFAVFYFSDILVTVFK